MKKDQNEGRLECKKERKKGNKQSVYTALWFLSFQYKRDNRYDLILIDFIDLNIIDKQNEYLLTDRQHCIY